MEKTAFGFLNINKPSGRTAHDVVAAVRKILRIKQVGHGGTLDPMATGVLPIAVGKATRLLRFLDGDKTYLARIQLGLRTTTDDIEGEILDQSDGPLPDEAIVAAELTSFAGPQRQIPPNYSAVHIGGRRLYELARSGNLPEEVPARDVVVYSIEPLSFEPPIMAARISCSAGTYIRSIARDLGMKLGCGGCLAGLVREQAGPFNLADSITLEDLAQAAGTEDLQRLLVPPQHVLPLTRLNVTEPELRQLTRGQTLSLNTTTSDQGAHVMAIYKDELVAVCRVSSTPGIASAQPEVVLASAE